MKPQAGQLQIVQRLRLVQGVENLDASLDQILPDPTTPSRFEQILDAFIGKRFNHGAHHRLMRMSRIRKND
jgi:hypothetical protein